MRPLISVIVFAIVVNVPVSASTDALLSVIAASTWATASSIIRTVSRRWFQSGPGSLTRVPRAPSFVFIVCPLLSRLPVWAQPRRQASRTRRGHRRT